MAEGGGSIQQVHSLIRGLARPPPTNSSMSVDKYPTISKRFSEFYDPCQEAADRSMRCLHRNPEDKDLCSDYFQ